MANEARYCLREGKLRLHGDAASPTPVPPTSGSSSNLLWKNCTTRVPWSVASSASFWPRPDHRSASVWECRAAQSEGSAWFPYNSAAIFSMSAAFFTIWLVSILDNSAQAKKERELYPAQQLRSETGLGASSAAAH
jgi:cation/acetate symporter